MPVIESSEQNNKEENNKKGVEFTAGSGYAIFTQFILDILLFVGGAIALGLFLDKKLGTKCLFLLIFVFLFGFVPFYNLIKRVNKYNR